VCSASLKPYFSHSHPSLRPLKVEYFELLGLQSMVINSKLTFSVILFSNYSYYYFLLREDWPLFHYKMSPTVNLEYPKTVRQFFIAGFI
jgi:hypothetical protein